MEQEPDQRHIRLPWLPHLLEGLDDLLHAVVAVVLVGVSVAVLAHVLTQDALGLLAGFRTPRQFFEPVLATVNDTLFVIIVLEVLRTVIAHFQHESFALRPFVIIGIISTVRHLLMVGARLLLTEGVPVTQFQHSIIELGLSGVLTFVLVAAYALLRYVDRHVAVEDGSPTDPMVGRIGRGTLGPR
jgi:uncharacterized membrane protein (DUF373 family)